MEIVIFIPTFCCTATQFGVCNKVMTQFVVDNMNLFKLK